MNRPTRMSKIQITLADVLRAEASGEDLRETDNGRIAICAKTRDGSLYDIGDVAESAFFQKGVNPWAMVEKVKFHAAGGNNDGTNWFDARSAFLERQEAK